MCTDKIVKFSFCLWAFSGKGLIFFVKFLLMNNYKYCPIHILSYTPKLLTVYIP